MSSSGRQNGAGFLLDLVVLLDLILNNYQFDVLQSMDGCISKVPVQKNLINYLARITADFMSENIPQVSKMSA